MNDVSMETFFAQELPKKDIPIWDRLKNKNDSTAPSDALKELEPVIVKAVNSFASGDKMYMTQARMMALKAAPNYDPKKGANFSTYIYGQLMPLQRLSAQRGNLTKISENVSIQRSALRKAMRELTNELGMEPTTEQLADHTGFSIKRIDSLMNYKPIVSESAAVNPEGDAFMAHNPEKTLDVYDQVIYNELSDTDKRIYEWSTGFGKGEKLKGTQIAAKLGITPAAVSKRYANIAQKFGRDRELIRRTVVGA